MPEDPTEDVTSVDNNRLRDSIIEAVTDVSPVELVFGLQKGNENEHVVKSPSKLFSVIRPIWIRIKSIFIRPDTDVQFMPANCVDIDLFRTSLVTTKLNESLTHRDFSGTDFGERSLANILLRDCILSACDLSKCQHLTPGQLSGSDMTNATLPEYLNKALEERLSYLKELKY